MNTISSFLRRSGWGSAVALTTLLGTAGAASAANYTVLNNGSSGADTLRGVLAQAQADSDVSDTITFASNVTGTIALGGSEIVIGKSVTVTGPGANVLTIDAGGQSRVFDITSPSATVAISGLTLAHGNISNDPGGALYNVGTLTVTACAFSGNASSVGGGGLYNGGTLTVTSSTFSGNSAVYGGGLFNDGTLTVTNSTFSGDSAGYSGGGLENTGTLTVTNSTFSANTARYSGGLYNDYGTLTLTACLFAGSSGGDLFSGNSVTSGGSNLLSDADEYGIASGVNHDQTGVADAHLGPLQSNGGPTPTCALLSGSPAIDADYSSSTATDGRGFGRPVGARNDIGAYEAGASATLSSVTISAAASSVAKGLTDQFTATAHYSDGTTADVTGTATWGSSDTGKATVDASGLATGVAEGTTQITAAFGGMTSAAVTLTVPHVPASLIVTNNLDDGSAGSLRTVLAAAGPGDTVTFASNVTGTITLASGEIPISQDVTIQGPGAGVLTVDAGGTSRVLDISGGTVVISGLTFANGSAANDFGGAIYNAGTLTVTGCVFTGDTATYGGSDVFNAGSGVLTLGNDTFLNGSTPHNGGSLFNGGGGSTATVTGCTFSGCTADDGGALYNYGTLTVTNSTVASCIAAYGGAILNGSLMTLTNDTFSGNTATGGGVLYDIGTGTTITASIFTGSNGGDFLTSGPLTSGGSNIIGDGDGNGFTNGVDYDQTGVANAGIGPLGSNGGPTQTCAVLPSSPAIGADYAARTLTDQRGVARAGTQHTVGAFEYVAAPLVPVLRSHVLWNNPDGRVMLWGINAQGSVTQNIFGPYDDTSNVGVPGNTARWSATALATGPDGMNHILWNNPDGRVMLWNVDDAGNFTLAGYGPYTDDSVGSDPSVNKWSATAVSVGPDNTVHLLWSNTDHRAMLWNVASDFSFTLAGYGPYTDDSVGSDPSVNLWSATALATGPDNVSRIVWNNTDGRVMLWNVDSAFNFTLAGYGPYTDNAPNNLWRATGVSVGPDNLTHLLWGNTDRRMALWNVDSAFNFTLAGFGPYTDDSVGSDPTLNLWSATAVATGSDNLSRVLWDNTDNRIMLWDMDSVFNFSLAGYGPFTDILNGGVPGGQWSAVAVSAN